MSESSRDQQDGAARRRLREELVAMRAELLSAEAGAVHPDHRQRALNLAQFLVLRRRNLDPLQAELSRHGLARLGVDPRRVQATLDASLNTLAPGSVEMGQAPVAIAEPLPGPARPDGRSRIMVTLPDEAAEERMLVRDLLAAGADLARINTGRHAAAHWTQLALSVQQAAAVLQRDCPIYMDLQGPRLRSAPLVPGPRARRIRSRRGRPGAARELGFGLLHPAGLGPRVLAGDISIPIAGDWSLRREPGEKLILRDARGARRVLRVLSVDETGARVEARRTVWLETGGRIRAQGDEPGVVGELPPMENWLSLAQGDALILHADNAARDLPREGETAAIGCTLPAALRALKIGQRVLFDEGRIVALCEEADSRAARLRVIQIRGGRARLRGDRGINLPDTDLSHIPPLGESDMANLPFIAEHADLVGLSFVTSPADIDTVAASLAAAGDGRRPILVAKIETASAFRNLPDILFGLLKHERAAVMIARGDLAVELGYEHLAEAQEEILTLCAAAGLPVIWATQVLDSLARSGQPTRAELTDAAAAARADCVMLNKGPHLVAALELLSEILGRS